MRKIQQVWMEWGANSALTLRWVDMGPGAPAALYGVYLNGELFTRTAATRALAPLTGPGKLLHVDVLALSELELPGDYSTLLYVAAVGARLKVTAAMVDLLDNPDFEAYEVAMSDDGSTPTVVAGTLKGANNNVFTTRELVDGVTYRFRVRLRDFRGNVGEWGPEISGAVNAPPKAPTTAAAAYVAASRTATITASQPAGQAADCVGYLLLSNMLPGVGLQEAIYEGAALAWLAVSAPAGLTYTTPELCEGLWKFEWRAVDGAGVMSEGAGVELNLVKSGGQLVQAGAAPVRPRLVDAVAIAGGKARLTVRAGNPAAGQTIVIYRDGVADIGQVVTAGRREYEIETVALLHGLTYAFYATVATATAESAPSETMSVTVDAQAPAGDLTLALETVA